MTTFVEVGPGNVLSGLLKRIDSSVKAISVNDLASLNAAASSCFNCATSDFFSEIWLLVVTSNATPTKMAARAPTRTYGIGPVRSGA